jgi:hypothetical protein
MPTKAELEAELASVLAGESPPDITLTKDETELTKEHPEYSVDIWDETQNAIMLKHWRYVMQAQVVKALRGDTASAKFLTDFAQEMVSNSREKDNAYNVPSWEEKAIAIRDSLGVEVSAEVLVELLLDSVSKLSPAMRRRVLPFALGGSG